MARNQIKAVSSEIEKMRNFTTADTHFGHGNIIKYSNRPFSDSTEMNERLIHNWNERIKPEDQVFFLGDFCFKSGEGCLKAEYWQSRLNGHVIYVRGNHDNNNSLKTIIDCVHVTYANTRINMVHKPEHANPDFEVNLVGHVHDKWRIRTFQEHYFIIEKIFKEALKSDRQDWKTFLEKNYPNRNSHSVLLNVGVDVQKYMPISLDEALGQVIRFQKGVSL
jgi:calcineurin-like phosphoesterase family protein